jgi:hypothetical protein
MALTFSLVDTWDDGKRGTLAAQLWLRETM